MAKEKRAPALACTVLVAAVLTSPYLLRRASLESGGPQGGSSGSSAANDNRSVAVPDPPSYFFIGNSEQVARRKWAATLQWRALQGMDTILSEPPPNYELINRFVPTSLHTRDKKGNLVLIERWGSVNLEALKEHGLTNEDFLQHYRFQIEWLWSVAAPKEDEKVTLIMDVGNVTMDQITPSVISFIQKRVLIGCEHFPNRGAHLIVVNIPSWWQYGWALVQPLLSETVKAATMFLTAEDLRAGALWKIIERDQLVPEYGGRSRVPFGRSDVDLRQVRLVERLEQQAVRGGWRQRRSAASHQRKRSESAAAAAAAMAAADALAREGRPWWLKPEGWGELGARLRSGKNRTGAAADWLKQGFQCLQRDLAAGVDELVGGVDDLWASGVRAVEECVRNTERDVRASWEKFERGLVEMMDLDDNHTFCCIGNFENAPSLVELAPSAAQ